ncbi:MAG: carboxylating nicotinate-nucleotide diphosphorylase, partial [Gammaproteobacteria bacterium]
EWFETVFHELNDEVVIGWLAEEGEFVKAGTQLCSLQGSARALLTGERTALNLLQTLSATATISQKYANKVEGTSARILDTRKTIPGLRNAQKYAVSCGGCYNHRVGLYDGILIKENHILAAGSILAAVSTAKVLGAGVPVEVEVETLDEAQQALSAGADILLLDNFDLEMLRKAVELNKGQAKLEASGNVSLETIRSIAETGVDFISVGALTKNVEAVDLSMRIEFLE